MIIDSYWTEEEKLREKGQNVKSSITFCCPLKYILAFLQPFPKRSGSGTSADDDTEDSAAGLTMGKRVTGCFKNLTAKKINRMQMIGYPVAFFIFTFLYALSAFFKIGDVDTATLLDNNIDDE